MTSPHESDAVNASGQQGNPDQVSASSGAPTSGGVPGASAAGSQHDARGIDEGGAIPDQAGAPDNAQADDLDMSAFEAQVEDSELSEALARIAELEDQLARANASWYNLDQEYKGYVRRSKEAASAYRDGGHSDVIEALLPVLDDIYAARAAGDLNDGPFAAIATKLEETLMARFSLERFGNSGEDFDPTLHEALMAQTSAEVDHPVVAQVLQPGYRRGEKILRAVKVLVDNPQ